MASPAARAIAASEGLDLSKIQGTGPHHRIVKADVLDAKALLSQQPQIAAPAAAPQAAPSQASASYTDIPRTNLRKIISTRLTESKRTIPHYYLTVECNVDPLMKARAELNAKAKNNEYKLSVNDFVIKACALALRKVPTVNSSWNDNFIRRFNNIDINIAINTEQGLYSPLLTNVDAKGLVAIANGVKDLAEKAKINKLSPAEVASGTFTISNMGMMGLTEFSAVINPPQVAILAVSAAHEKLVLLDSDGSTEGRVGKRNVMNVTLSADHRVVDGAVGASWLQAFKSYLEDPLSLLL